MDYIGKSMGSNLTANSNGAFNYITLVLLVLPEYGEYMYLRNFMNGFELLYGVRIQLNAT
jgi:hypothetical protein